MTAKGGASRLDIMMSSGNYTYDMFHNAIETTDYFFVYINNYSTYVIAKNRFLRGTPQELRAFLLSIFGKKFKIKA